MNKQKRQLRVLLNEAYNRIGGWAQGKGGFTIAFVYPKNGRNFVLKGCMRSVKRLIKQYHGPAIVYYTIYHHGKPRTIEEIINLPKGSHAYIWHEGPRSKNKKRYTIKGCKNGQYILGFQLKRQPRCWLKQLDILL